MNWFLCNRDFRRDRVKNLAVIAARFSKCVITILRTPNILGLNLHRSNHPEVFCEKCSEKFRKIHRKIPVPEFLF